MADRLSPRVGVMPPPSPSKYRDGAGIAEWLVEQLVENARPMDEAGHMKGVAFGARTDT
jgi:hypothetical protein